MQVAAIETYGRHGEGLFSLLESLADSARKRDRDFGYPPTRWLKRWRVQLSCVLARLVGRAIMQACPAGKSLC